LEHNLFRRERVRERPELQIGQRIDQIIVAGNADLDQAKLFEIAMQTVRLRVDRDTVGCLQLREELGELGVSLNNVV